MRSIKGSWYIGNTESKKCLRYGFMAGTAVGTLIGVAAGILIAPKSGKETREAIITEFEEDSKRISNNFKQCCTNKKDKQIKAEESGNTETEVKENL